MKKAMMLSIMVAGLVVAGAASAQSGAELAKSKNCLTCHDMEKKKVGPAFKAIAEKYKGNKDAAATLTAKLKEAKGHPKVAAGDAELKTLVEYVLSGK
jgi:cytochrome c